MGLMKLPVRLNILCPAMNFQGSVYTEPATSSPKFAEAISLKFGIKLETSLVE
jgi:hypothetical protein